MALTVHPVHVYLLPVCFSLRPMHLRTSSCWVPEQVVELRPSTGVLTDTTQVITGCVCISSQ